MTSRYEKNERKRKHDRDKIRKKRTKKFTRFLFLAILLLSICLGLWGSFFEINYYSSNDYIISNDNIPDSFDGVKIVHFSDVLYNDKFDEKRLDKLVRKINSYKPDVVIFTGDLINKNYSIKDSDSKILTKYLSKIKSKLGKYAVCGDNDFYNNEYDNIMYDAEFLVLKNNYDTIYNEENTPILIYGLDSYNKGTPDMKNFKNKEIDNITYKIVAVHEGDYVDEFISDYDVNLILAGNSLNGTVNIPFIKNIFIPKGSKTYYDKHYKLNNSDLYVSNGVGTFKYNFRLFNNSSINVYRLKK